MSVVAKMRVVGRKEFTGVSKGEGITQVNITLQAIYDEGANSQWSKWTPTGEVQMTITNPDAYNQFVLGKAYLLTFELTED